MLGTIELLTLLVLVVAVPAVLIWVLIRSRRRGIAELTAAQEATERRLAEIAAELSTMRTQLASLERVLTQVE